MVQTRGQQAREQSPNDVSSGTARGVTAEGNAITMAAFLGHSPMSVVMGSKPRYSANTPRAESDENGSAVPRGCSDSPALSVGAQDDEHGWGHEHPRNVSTQRLSASPHEGVGTVAMEGLLFRCRGWGYILSLAPCLVHDNEVTLHVSLCFLGT